jgi:hypothetical protein
LWGRGEAETGFEPFGDEGVEGLQSFVHGSILAANWTASLARSW